MERLERAPGVRQEIDVVAAGAAPAVDAASGGRDREHGNDWRPRLIPSEGIQTWLRPWKLAVTVWAAGLAFGFTALTGAFAGWAAGATAVVRADADRSPSTIGPVVTGEAEPIARPRAEPSPTSASSPFATAAGATAAGATAGSTMTTGFERASAIPVISTARSTPRATAMSVVGGRRRGFAISTRSVVDPVGRLARWSGGPRDDLVPRGTGVVRSRPVW